jgi:hypothetical protein
MKPDWRIDLHSRVHRGAYRAQPSRRVYIPKPDGRQRPLGIATLEDKIVQQAAVTIHNQIYEVDFQGFSYGFRPGRSPHQALDALYVGIQRKRVNNPLLLGVFLDRSYQQIVRDVVEKTLDVQIDDPVMPPASLACLPHRFQRRLPGAIPIGIRMKEWFQQWLEFQFYHHLRDPIRNGRYAQFPSPPFAFGIFTVRTGGGK